MEEEALQILKEIRTILYWIGAAVSIGVAFWVVRSFSMTWIQFRKSIGEDWKLRASDYFDKGEYNKLISHCEDKFASHPNDTNAIWWLARAYQGKNDLKKADELFIKLLQIEPGLKQEFVDPYVTQLPANK